MPPENPCTFLMGPCEHSAGHVTIPKLSVCSWCPMWRRKGSSCQSYVISEAPYDTVDLPKRVVSLWRREKPCFGVAKTGTDFMHAHCLTCLQQGYLASSIRTDAELPWVQLAVWCQELSKAWKKDLNMNLGSHFSPENLSIIRQICQCCFDSCEVFAQGTAVPCCESVLPSYSRDKVFLLDICIIGKR